MLVCVGSTTRLLSNRMAWKLTRSDNRKDEVQQDTGIHPYGVSAIVTTDSTYSPRYLKPNRKGSDLGSAFPMSAPRNGLPAGGGIFSTYQHE